MKASLIVFFCLICLSANAQVAKLSKAIKEKTITNISASLISNYIYLDTANKMSANILRRLKSGAYDSIKTPDVFALRITADLLSVYHDEHLSISYEPAFTDNIEKPGPAAERTKMLSFRKKVNFGFDKAEILPGNIGYLKIGGFFAPDDSAKAMTLAAFKFVSNSEALIMDLRNNNGGDPAMISFICGLFFSHKTHLNDLYSRSNNTKNEFWAIPDTTLKAFNNMPIYILTNKHTFSAGEELTYDLQSQKRAIVVGQATAGGAHPVKPFIIGNGFIANIPFARAINPITKSNWETAGVQPDVSVASDDDALTVTLNLIKQRKKH